MIEIANFRSSLADTLLYIYYFLGDKCLELLYKALVSSINSQDSHWEYVEAVIFCLNAVSEGIREENSWISQAFEMVGKLTFSNETLLKSVLDFIGKVISIAVTNN